MKGRGGGGMLTFLVLLPLRVATLHRCLVVLLRCIHEGVGWWGHVNVPCTSSAACCYAAQMSGSVASLYTWRGGVGGNMLTFLVLLPLHVATLHRCLVVLLRCIYEGAGWWGHVNVPCTSSAACCYAAQMSGSVASLYTWRGGVGGNMLTFLVLLPLHVATLHRCLVVLLRCILEGVGWGGTC